MASAIPSLLVAYEGDTALMGFTSISQGFFMLGSGPNLNNVSAGGSETDAQTPFSAGTISNLWCRVKTAATVNSTVVLRKNGANGNETFSIGANTTGAFSNATDTDSIASGDKIDVGITPGSTALVITIIAATFSSTNMSNTVTHMLSFQDLSSQPTVTGTYYSTPSGVTAYKTSSYNSTEANSKLRMGKAFTVNNFATFVTGGSGGTLNSRKIGTNGNITVNLNVGSAQLVQDTTHSDNLAVGDDFDWQFSDTGTNYSYDFYSCDFTSTNGDCIFACATDDPVTSINTSVTAYYGLAGSLDTSQSTETNAQVTVNNAFKFSQLTCNVTSNSITGNSTVNLRKNAGNAGPTLSIGANATGIFNDNTNTYTAAATDVMNYQIVTGSTGTSISISFIEVYGNATPAAAATGPKYQHFDNTPRRVLGRQNYNSFGGGQMVIFG
jgi:hypothetical protein